MRNKRLNKTTTYQLSSLRGYHNPTLFHFDEYFKRGCVRSTKCLRVTMSPTNICTKCRQLRKDKLFVSTLRRKAAHKRQDFTNDRFCSQSLLCQRLKKLRSKNGDLKLSNFTLSKKVVSLSKIKRTLSSVMAEAVCRKDQKSIYHNMTRAFKKGYFDNKRQVLSFITDISANLHRKTRGKRYTDSLKDLYTWLRIKGGPRVIRFLQDNMDGPGN